MIARATGEIHFLDGLSFTPQVALSPEHLRHACNHSSLKAPGWTKHVLGIHDSDHGNFEVEAVSDPSCHIQVVFLSHSHPFYQPGTPSDAERRVFHESVIATDLGGQQEFSWGQVFCRLDNASVKDWLVVAYTIGPQIPLHPPDSIRQLHAHTDET